MPNTALIIIDMQVGLLEDENYPIFNKELLISNINALISKARNANVPIIFVRHTEGSGSPLEINQPGWQISSELDITGNDIIIDKYTPDCFHQTTLMDILKKQNISKLVIAGLQTEYCIDTTCRRSFTLGFDTVLISDAHSTCDSPLLSAEKIINHHNQVLSNVFVTLHDHGYNDFK
jgi:nicotinamidase-related amidase